MFTGLIKDIGTIKSVQKNSEGAEITITSKLCPDIEVDDSVATNGVCLTATSITDNTFKVQAVHMTLKKSNIGELRVGSKVNLELALRPIDRMGGHFVQGHVNGVGKFKSATSFGKNWECEFSAPKELFKYIINEGSITIDGISLTVAKVKQDLSLIHISEPTRPY